MFLERFRAQLAWKEAVYLDSHQRKALLIRATFKWSHARRNFSHTEKAKVLSVR